VLRDNYEIRLSCSHASILRSFFRLLNGSNPHAAEHSAVHEVNRRRTESENAKKVLSSLPVRHNCRIIVKFMLEVRQTIFFLKAKTLLRTTPFFYESRKFPSCVKFRTVWCDQWRLEEMVYARHNFLAVYQFIM